ncbi:18530_t:CDS:10 [Funneliformis geosporum]|uniref:2645_t:CDS:1 n=1 Tax=Funneliformis geosporum TaxID=1117311 RepID=A0A9W4T083_9GLOM|nr:2645_t:CDS:10 [Funneliformis geosporum]CAI2191989.1 18530_t:CDS:10 [Funneliformis geosporum]
MDYKVPAHIEIDTYFSTNPVSEWHRLNAYMNSKLGTSPLSTAPDLYRSFHRSLAIVEKNEAGSYPKYIVEYAKKLKTAVKSKKIFFIELAEKIIDRIDRRELMRENNIDICEKQTVRDQASKSKALDDITNAITGKRKRDSNDNYENELNEEMVKENYATSAREPSNDFAISSFGIEVSSKQILTWDHVIPKMEIKENSLKDWINEGHNFSEDFRQFQKFIIEKLKVNPILSYVTDCESIIALSSIMILRKNQKPAYVSCTDNEWRMTFPRITYKFKMPALVQSTHIMRGELAEFEELWRLNWSKVSLLDDQDDKRIFDSVQIITRNFFYNLPYGKKKNQSDEDTYAHRTCHVILEEIFRVETMQLVWANGESSSSKNQCSGDSDTHGLKPDFRLICKDENESEILFGEIKPPKVENHKSIANHALAKLATLMKSALDIGIHDETYGVLINGNRIEFWRITLEYDGLYQLVSLVEMTFPTEAAEFLVIISAIERCYELRELVLETDRKGNSHLNDNYQRDSNYSPMKTKVPVINIQTSGHSE